MVSERELEMGKVLHMSHKDTEQEDLEVAEDLAAFSESAAVFYPVLHDLEALAEFYGIRTEAA